MKHYEKIEGMVEKPGTSLPTKKEFLSGYTVLKNDLQICISSIYLCAIALY
jgi:hypothetical protein